MLQTEEVIGKRKSWIAANEVSTAEGGEAASALANAVLLAEAQKGFVGMEAKQMETRSRLDKFWVMFSGSVAGAVAGVVVGGAAGYLKTYAEGLSGSYEAQINGMLAHLTQAKEALELLGQQGTINAPEASAELIQQWAQSAGGGDVAASQAFIDKMSMYKNVTDFVAQVGANSHMAMRVFAGGMALLAAGLPFKPAIEAFFKGGWATAFVAQTTQG